MLSNNWNFRLEISVVHFCCVNLNEMSVHIKNWEIKNQSVHWFGLTELSKTIGRMCCMKIAKHIFLYAAFLFLLSIFDIPPMAMVV